MIDLSSQPQTCTQQDLALQLDAVLPQTQCTKCGFDGCRPYAEAMAIGAADCNQCPPGGQQGVSLLSQILGKANKPLNIEHGKERSRSVAIIDEAICIGCTLCIQACPVDAIVGAAKQMHSVLAQDCTGCDLCVAPCPVDCISMMEVTPGKMGWEAWSTEQANHARKRFYQRKQRLLREQKENITRLAAKARSKLQVVAEEIPQTPAEQAEQLRKTALLTAAIERAKQNHDGKL